MKRATAIMSIEIAHAFRSPRTLRASTLLLRRVICLSIFLSSRLFRIAAPPALRRREATHRKTVCAEGRARLATTIPARPVNATLIIIPGLERIRAETAMVPTDFFCASLIAENFFLRRCLYLYTRTR